MQTLLKRTSGSMRRVFEKDSNDLSCRWLGYGKHWKNQPKAKRRRQRNRPKNPMASKPPNNLFSPSHTPPNMIHTTGSPHVYVSKSAVEQDSGDSPFLDEFLAQAQVPRSFQLGTFEYFASTKFNHNLPEKGHPEIAFLGRSNVGKSSLVNAIMRNKLARMSKQPGRTQQAHFFGLVPDVIPLEHRQSHHSVEGFLVDLPGYGFAVGPDEVVDRWQKQTQSFLLSRRDNGSLKRLFLLLDSRNGMTALDQTVASWLDEAEIPYTLVWTKADQVGPASTIRRVNEACMRYATQIQNLVDDSSAGMFQSPVVHTTSSKSGSGVPELMWSIEAEFFGHT